MEYDVVCAGHAAYDVVFTVSRFPEQDTKCVAQGRLEAGGGPAATAACLLAHWGLRTLFIGEVADDVHGAAIRADFDDWGVDTAGLRVRRGGHSALSCIIVDAETGSRTIVNHRQPRPVSAAEVAPLTAGAVLVDGHEHEVAGHLLEHNPEALSLLDAGSFRFETDDLARRVSHYVASTPFACAATGVTSLDPPEQWQSCLERLAARYPGRLAVTLGARGVIARDGDSGLVHLAAPERPVLDTTGAGDIFHGAYLWGLLRGRDERRSLQLANAAAALSVSRAGGRSSIPTLQDALELAAPPASAHG